MDIISSNIDFDAFKDETGLEDEQIKELYEGFLEELEEEKNKLASQLDDKDYIKLARTIHNIKGISGSYKLTRVYTIACSLDAAMKEQRTEGVESAVLGLTQEMDVSASAIRRRFGF